MHRLSGSRVPEKTRTRLTRPTYGSLVVFTTSATSGPSGSQVTGSAAAPAGVNASGLGCSDGRREPAHDQVEQLGAAHAVDEQTGRTG